MSIDTIAQEYYQYQNKINSRLDQYRVVAQQFAVTRALYPGSHIDIAPSLVIPTVTYVDNFKGTKRFFRNMQLIHAFVETHKEYPHECNIVYLWQDYSHALSIDPVDLIISQYGGFAGQTTKAHLSIGGILLCNDSHGDATLTKFDPDFRFIGIITENNTISTANKDDYFVQNAHKEVDITRVKQRMKGPTYSVSAENYIFQKIK